MPKSQKSAVDPRSRGKRPFSQISDSPSPRIRTRRQKLGRSRSSRPLDYFALLPDNALRTILGFLPFGFLKTLKFLSRDFYQYVSQMYTVLNFEDKANIPAEFLRSILRKCLRPAELRFGPLRNLRSSDFSQEIVTVLNLREVRVLDFSRYGELNDEILLRCLGGVDPARLSELRLPYSCGITARSLLFIEQHVRSLCLFQLDSKYSRGSNPGLDQAALARILLANPELVSFCLESATAEFLQTLAEQGFRSESLGILKIRNLELNEFRELRHLLALGGCPNLLCLTLMEIFVRNKLVNFDHPEVLENFEKLFEKLESVKHLKLGHFTTAAMLDLIAENVPSLQIFKVVSEHLEVEELEGFFFNCGSLMTLEGKVGVEYNFVHFEKRKIIFIF